MTKSVLNILEPFFDKDMISYQINAMIIIWLTLVLFWPKKSLPYYIESGNPPLTFLMVFVIALIIYSWLNLILGHQELPKNRYASWKMYAIDNQTHEPKSPFTPLKSLFHTLWLLLPIMPFLLMSAGICGISIQDFLASLSTFFMTSLLCGLFGSMIGRILGQRRSIRFLITRLFLTFLIFATGFFGPYVNPILLICEINKGEKMLVSHLISAYSLYMGIAVIASGLLMMGIHVIIRRDKK